MYSLRTRNAKKEQKNTMASASMIPRIVLTRYKMHNEEENIEASQRTVTDNAKFSKNKQSMKNEKDICEDKTLLQEENKIVSKEEKSNISTDLTSFENINGSDISISEISKIIVNEDNYKEKKLDSVTTVVTNKCKITNIDTVNTKYIIRNQSCIDDPKDNNYSLHRNTDMSNINDFVKNDIRNASNDIINDLNISPIITDMLEKKIIDCSFMNSSQFSNSFNTDVCFNSISLDNNNEKQSPSTSCKFQEIETNNVNLCFAQDTDTKVQETDIENDSDYVESEYSLTASDSEDTEKSEHGNDIKNNFSNAQNDSTISTGIDVSNTKECETRQDEQTVIPTKLTGTKKYMCVFCNKLQTKIARHFELVHSNEPDVQKFKYLPKGCSERRNIIDTLRGHRQS